MTLEPSISSRAAVALLISVCGCARTPPSAKPDRPEAAPSVVLSNAPKETAAKSTVDKRREVPPDVALMLKPSPCKPEFVAPVEMHARELKDESGVTYKAFLLGTGERLCLDAGASSGSVSDLRLLTDTGASGSPQERTVSIEMKHTSIGTVLAVRNPYSKPLRYRALMQLPDNPPAKPTTTCPVPPGIVGMEHWPHAVEVMLLKDFTLLEPNDDARCK
jgi:hypothetical protein